MKIEENENSNLVMFGVQLALANSVGFATSSVLGDRSKYLIPLILHNQQQGRETKDLEQSAFTKFKAILQEKEEGILRFNLVRKHKHFDFRIYYNQHLHIFNCLKISEVISSFFIQSHKIKN